MKKIMMIIAPSNFRDEEFIEPKKVLENAGYKVDVASLSKAPAKGVMGMVVKPSLTLEEALQNISDYDAVVFVGGGGARAYFNNKTALGIAKKSFEIGKITAAICIAPVILANAGILKGKEATVFNGDLINVIKEEGAQYLDKDVVVDGKIVTANGPSAAKEFGNSIVKLLK